MDTLYAKKSCHGTVISIIHITRDHWMVFQWTVSSFASCWQTRKAVALIQIYFDSKMC